MSGVDVKDRGQNDSTGEERGDLPALQSRIRKAAEHELRQVLESPAPLGRSDLYAAHRLAEIAETQVQGGSGKPSRWGANSWITAVGTVLAVAVLVFLALPPSSVRFTLTATVDGLELRTTEEVGLLGARGEVAPLLELQVADWDRLDYGGITGAAEGRARSLQGSTEDPIQVEWLRLPADHEDCWTELSVRETEPRLQIRRATACRASASLLASLPYSSSIPQLKAEGNRLTARLEPTEETMILAESLGVAEVRFRVVRETSERELLSLPTLRNGKLRIWEMSDDEVPLHFREEINIELIEGTLTMLRFDGDALSVSLMGDASDLRRDTQRETSAAVRSLAGLLRPTLMPTRLEILASSQPLKLFWAALAFLWPITSGLVGLALNRS